MTTAVMEKPEQLVCTRMGTRVQITVRGDINVEAKPT